MKKRIITDSTLSKSMVISNGEFARVYRLKDGSILKVFDPAVLRIFKEIGVDLELKILDARRMPNAKEILIPTAAAYKSNTFVGYMMPCARGVNYNKIDNNLSFSDREDLWAYAKRHNSIENVLVRAEDVIFPDLCTCDNIFIDENGRVQFIDYDGLQVGKHQSYVMSGALGNQIQYYTPKYRTGDLFNKNLDKKSSIFLYFVSAFNVNLEKIGCTNPFTGMRVTLDSLFKELNLDDPDVCHKVWKLFQQSEDNDFLRDDVFRMAEKYDMKIVGRRRDGVCIKRLIKK